MSDTIHIIACSVFRDALTYLAEIPAVPPFSVTFLPSYLHLRPNELRDRLLGTIEETMKTGICIGCLYGQCFTDIDRHLNLDVVQRIPGNHCYEVLLGRTRYSSAIDECPGTFFVEKELLVDFDDLCRLPLELDDPELRGLYFSNYRQLLYIRQPRDPDLFDRVRTVAAFLDLQYKVMDADYSLLKLFIDQLYRREQCNSTPL